MASAQSGGLTGVPGYVPRPASVAPSIPSFNPVPRPVIPDSSVPRINAGAEQSLLDQFGTLDERYKFDRQFLSEGLKEGLSGLNYRLSQNPDGSLSIDSTNTPGIKQRQAVQSEKNQGAAKGQLYSSFTDQAIGNSLSQIGKAATEAIAQYGFNIKKSNDAYLTEAQTLGGRISELLTDDAKYAAENFVPPPAPSGPGTAMDAKGSPIIWKGPVYPNLNTLRARHPGQIITVKRMGDGGFVAVLGGTATPTTAMPTGPPAPPRVSHRRNEA